MKKALLALTMFATLLFAIPALAQEADASIDPKAVDDIAEAFKLFTSGAWLLGVALVSRLLTTIVKGFSPLWDILSDKPHLKWVYPTLIALLTALATAPLFTTNWIVVVVVSVVAAALSGFAAVGWYHGPTWIGGDPLKHEKAAPVPTKE